MRRKLDFNIQINYTLDNLSFLKNQFMSVEQSGYEKNN
jgi:hypothetical protein